MKCTTFFLLASLLVQSAHGSAIDVWALMGQSNANGVATPPVPPAPLNVQDNLYIDKQKNPNVAGFLEATTWGTVQTRYPNGFGITYGPEIAFAYEMQQRTGEKVAIIKTAQGGSGLQQHWLPATNDVYPWALAKIQSSLADLVTLGYEPTLKGVLWVQGETDATNLAPSNAYSENLATLFDTLRTDLNAPELPIYLNLLNGAAKHPYKNILRAEQAEFIATYPNALGFDSTGLPLSADMEHYAAAGQLGLGNRFADLVHPWADFNGDHTVDAADLTSWQASIETQDLAADGNADGMVDGSDFLLWQRQTSVVAPAVSVPEPSGALLALCAVGLFIRKLKPATARLMHKLHRLGTC